MRKSFIAICFLFSIAFTVTATGADKASWPDKPVTVIVPSAPGGSADVLTRLILNHVGKNMGANFVIMNRPGAAGSIGMSQIARAQPDGYTLGYGNINTLAVNPALFNKLPYDANNDFTFVGRIFDVYNLLVVSANSSYKTVSDLIKDAKTKPGVLSYGAGSIGSSGNMAGELFKHMADIDTLFVPYNGDPASLSDLSGGRISYTFTNASVAWPLVKSGKLRALAITSLERAPFFPDIPTLNESGLPGYENVAWGGLVFPRGTPDSIVKKLSIELQKSLASDSLTESLAKISSRPGDGGPAEFAKYVTAEQKKWDNLVKTAHIPKQN